jgi:hypothetical protein
VRIGERRKEQMQWVALMVQMNEQNKHHLALLIHL